MNQSNPISLFTGSTGFQGNQFDSLSARDLQRPWQSAYGFPMAAARLAAQQPLILHCREDEVFDRLASLNDLLAQPETLQRAYAMLTRLKSETQQRLVRGLELEQTLISDDERVSLIEAVTEALAHPPVQTVAARLAETLSPPTVGHELVGLKTMLARLERLRPDLAEVKEHGFHVVVHDRRRQPARPAAAPHYHLSLWAYLLVRSDHGQAAVWN